ncbi:hypothetical protein HID58_033684 [Brassica napus]|uniref:Uncharacterized protein n=1 Tax=Brassica napus TaxID=3708 RepID=A0ABQ8C030_BRANA|nr:hypothetical protein HID58_033684 [Brassica napus]
MMIVSAYVPLWKQKDNTYMPHFSTKRTWILIRQITLHSIWWERNNRRHQATLMVGGSPAKMIDRHIRNWCLTVSATGHQNYEALLQL